jgi:hypothetical protein
MLFSFFSKWEITQLIAFRVEEICEALKYKKTTAPTVNKVVSTYQDAISRVCKLIEGSKEAPRPKGLLELPPPGPAEESAPAGNDPTPSAGKPYFAAPKDSRELIDSQNEGL